MRDSGSRPHLLASGTLGMQGFCFLDLGVCSFREEEKKAAMAADPEEEAAPPAVAGATDEKPKVVTKRVLYPAIGTATAVEWASLTKR